MIVFDLECRAGGHRFEGWFGSSEDFRAQQQRGLVACPQCHSADVVKAPMAPNLARKGNQVAVPASAAAKRMETAQHPERAATAVMAAPQGIARGAGPIALTPAGIRLPPEGITLPPEGITLPPEAVAMVQAIARMQAEALKASCWVGEKF